MMALKQQLEEKANEEYGFSGKYGNATQIGIENAIDVLKEWLVQHQQKQMDWEKTHNNPLGEIFRAGRRSMLKVLLEELK